MDNETIDKLWNQAMPPSGEAEQRTRYRFAKLVAAHERKAIASMVKPLDESLADEILARGNHA